MHPPVAMKGDKRSPWTRLLDVVTPGDSTQSQAYVQPPCRGISHRQSRAQTKLVKVPTKLASLAPTLSSAPAKADYGMSTVES